MFRREALTRVFVLPLWGNASGWLLATLLISPAFLAPWISRGWIASLLIIAAAAVVMIDVRMRRRSSNVSAVVRWLSPFEGGNIALIPSWLSAIGFIGLLVYEWIAMIVRGTT